MRRDSFSIRAMTRSVIQNSICPLRVEPQLMPCLRLWTMLRKLVGDYVFWSHIFKDQPRNRWFYLKFLQLNAFAAMATTLGGVCMYEFSPKQLSDAMGRSAIFPLYFPHAIGLGLACKFQGSVIVGQLFGYFFARIYLVSRGPPEMFLSRACILFIIALLGVLETHSAAWLLYRYLCRRDNDNNNNNNNNTGIVPKTVPTIDNVSQAFLYIFIIFCTTLLFDTPIAVVACLSQIVQWHSFPRFWVTWWLGVVAGMLTLSPVIIHLSAVGLPLTFFRKLPNVLNLMKSVVLWVALVGLITLLFFLNRVQSFVTPLPYLIFPLIIFASFRFNHVGWAIVVAAISLCCAWGTLHRNNSFYYMAGAPEDRSSPGLILQIELFVTVMGLVAIVLAAAVKEKIQLTDDLNRMNGDLEEKVEIRTIELTEANQELRVSQKKAEHASHAKSDFLANMSHEIRTPIHGILGLAALLLESQLTADQRESLTSLKECADLLLHIINSVLDLSKIEAGRLEVETIPFSIRKIMSSTLRMMQARAHAHQLQLHWHIDTAVPDVVVGDSGKLQQCLLNLVGNALKFTNEGSVTVNVSMSTRKIDTEHEEITRSSAAPKVEMPPLFPRPTSKHPSRLAKLRSWGSWPGAYFRTNPGKPHTYTIDVHELSTDYDGSQCHSMSSTMRVAPVPEICSQPSTPETVDVEFEVHDTGIGISKEKLQDMFDPFTQGDASTSRLYGGTGLGLCIVRRFVELLGGTIWAESEVNKGSTFRFRVPFLVSSNSNFTYKPHHNRGPPRFSSLQTSSQQGSKNGLPRRAYSVDVLMQNIKFNLSSLVEGKNGEESVSVSVSSQGSGASSCIECIATQSSPRERRNHLSRQGLLHIVDKSKNSDSGKVLELRKSISSSSEEGSTDELEIRTPVQSDNNSTVINVSDRVEEATTQGNVVAIEVPRPENRSPAEEPYSVTCLVVETDTSDKNKVVKASPLKADNKVVKASPLKADPGLSKGIRKKPELAEGERALRILLAEDNPINQKVATRQLQRFGHKVSIVGDGKQALDAVQSNHEGYDLVLMDVQMPKMDGLQATELIREMETQRNWSRLPILGLTAHAIQGYQETCLSHGMDGYLGKPFEIQQLLKQMQELTSTNRGPVDYG